MRFERLAPAKINLFLHVGPLGDDGYHPVASLVTFADKGDHLSLLRGGSRDGLSIKGPFAEQLSADGDNLVTRARDLCLRDCPGQPPNLHLTLDKRLPVASGIGGGSSDAAATLVLMQQALGLDWLQGEDALAELALELGSDVPMCLDPRPALAQGRGERLEFPPPFPDLDAVLVNPSAPVSTGAVFGAFDRLGLDLSADLPAMPEAMESPEAVCEFLAATRNDLEAPAISLQPAIAEVLSALKDRPETLFARMSGSGATCFAICADQRERDDLAFALAAFHPTWWVQPCRLSGSYP